MVSLFPKHFSSSFIPRCLNLCYDLCFKNSSCASDRLILKFFSAEKEKIPASLLSIPLTGIPQAAAGSIVELPSAINVIYLFIFQTGFCCLGIGSNPPASASWDLEQITVLQNPNFQHTSFSTKHVIVYFKAKDQENNAKHPKRKFSLTPRLVH